MTTGTKWSAYQEAIFTFGREETGNAIVNAVAGSGKSTTLVQLIKELKGSTIFLAFNKAIADDLKNKGVNARTFHSLCYSPVLRHKKVQQVTENKLRRIIDAKLTGEDVALYGTFVVRLVGLARQVGIGCLVPDTEGAWMELVIHHDLEPESEQADLGRGIELAQKVLAYSNRQAMIDFDDMLYIAVKDGLNLQKFDNVLVDEAQDTNAIQRAILRKIMHSKTRLIAVGDPAQAIYGFRGADSNSMNLLKEEFKCKELPLSISYRCPTSVVKHAQQWVEHIEAAPGAAEGEVLSRGMEWSYSEFSPGDLVVCRATAPVIKLAFGMLKNRVPVQVMGREIGQGLVKLIDRMGAGSIDDLEVSLRAYTDREVQKAIAKKDEAKAEAISDKTDAVLTLIEGLEESERTIPALKELIDSLFRGSRGATILSTIHKAKGLEADTVFWLNSSQCPAQWARQEWQQQQEVNLCYVAVTRAKQTLVLIEEKESK